MIHVVHAGCFVHACPQCTQPTRPLCADNTPPLTAEGSLPADHALHALSPNCGHGVTRAGHSPLPAVPEGHIALVIAPAAQVLQTDQQQRLNDSAGEHACARCSCSVCAGMHPVAATTGLWLKPVLNGLSLTAPATAPGDRAPATTTPWRNILARPRRAPAQPRTCWRACCSNCCRLLAGLSLEVAAKLGYSSGFRCRSTGKDPRGAGVPAKGPSRAGGTQPLLLERCVDAQLDPAVSADWRTSACGCGCGCCCGSSGLLQPAPAAPEGTSWVVGSLPWCSCRARRCMVSSNLAGGGGGTGRRCRWAGVPDSTQPTFFLDGRFTGFGTTSLVPSVVDLVRCKGRSGGGQAQAGLAAR